MFILTTLVYMSLSHLYSHGSPPSGDD